MSERLDGLRRRRDLLRKELALVERQVEAEESALVAPGNTEPETPFDAEAEAEAILREFRRPPELVGGQAKKGCLLAYMALLVVFVALAAAGLLVYSRYVRGR